MNRKCQTDPNQKRNIMYPTFQNSMAFMQHQTAVLKRLKVML